MKEHHETGRTYVSKFPSDKNKWSSKAVFHTPKQDQDQYGRKADALLEVELPDEKAADDKAEGIVSDPNQEWSPSDNCADAVESVVNAGGLQTEHNDPLNTPENLKEELDELTEKPEEEKPRP